MEPGLVNYRDVKGGDVELIKKETIDNALDSLIGCPLTVGHIPTSITDFKDIARGYVDHAEYDADKGWFVCEGTIEHEDAREMIRKHKGVSVGTKLNTADFGPGGTWHNIPFGREIKRFKFHHLAIVPPDQRPRFEDAEIRLNSKPKNIMFKWIKSLTSQGNTSEQVSELAPTARLDLGEGKSATLQEMVDVARNNMCHSVHHDDHIEHEGIRYNVGHLIHAYKTHHGHTVHATPVHHTYSMPTPVATATHHGHVPGYDEGTKGHNPIAGMHHPRANAEEPKMEPKVEAKSEGEKSAEAKAEVRDNAVELAEKAKKEEAERANAAEKERNNASFKSLAEASLKKSFDSVNRLNSSGSINDRLARGKSLFGSSSVKN